MPNIEFSDNPVKLFDVMEWYGYCVGGGARIGEYHSEDGGDIILKLILGDSNARYTISPLLDLPLTVLSHIATEDSFGIYSRGIYHMR